MSKKFPKIKVTTRVLEENQNTFDGCFDSLPPQSSVIADLSFANGRHFFPQAQHWLQHALPSEKLYYWAFIESPSASSIFLLMI